MLDGQLDLDSVTVNPGYGCTRTPLTAPPGPVPAGTDLPSGGQDLTDRIVPGLSETPAVLPDIEGYSEWSGRLEQPGELFVSAAGDGWKLQVDGSDVSSSEALGWANSFPVEQAGSATLRFDTPVARWLALAGQVALWVIALAYLLRVRVREDESTELLPARPPPRGPGPRRDRRRARRPLRRRIHGGDLPTMAVPWWRRPPRRRRPRGRRARSGRRGRRRRSR